MSIEDFDPIRIRKDFPALDQTIHGKPLAYLDNAATSQKPRAVLDVLSEYYERDNANVHRGIHELSRRATVAFEAAREKVASWINAPSTAECVWTRGTTEAINLVATAWGLDHVGEGDEILISVMEHHSNIVPWQLLAARTGATLKYIEIDDEGRLVLDGLESLITERTKIVSISDVSNSLGTINPVKTIVDASRAVGAIVMVDGAQGVVHTKVDVQDLGCDFYAFGGHKMCGPTGVGVLWGRLELLEAMAPFQGGGEMIQIVERDQSSWAAVPHKFEAGTPNIAGAIGMGAAVDYLSNIGIEAIAIHESEIMAYAMAQLSLVPGLRMFGPSSLDDRSAVISFTMGDAHPHDISTILDTEGVAIRAGHHCAQLVMKHFGVSATARASFYLYSTQEDVDRLVEGLDQVAAIFG
ncbi:MAG TPA: cysteine desulfurase CsdA [Gemmatimonadetes bacterium]|nr:cysteine desulfurase CsdA [Gemmatimonadota bacterium]HCK61292.1 cysteine desulfurase CsdA [Gemmatimonadota bacterium]|tara:strand:- start:2326 stop:3561 length:1236 start_codon:yes stop_codon:yes gene_type:complete